MQRHCPQNIPTMVQYNNNTSYKLYTYNTVVPTVEREERKKHRLVYARRCKYCENRCQLKVSLVVSKLS